MRTKKRLSISGRKALTGWVFSIPFLIVYLSEFMTLQPGDMIATGTPKGLSDVVPGDEVIVEVEGVGRLVNHIISQQAYEETLS